MYDVVRFLHVLLGAVWIGGVMYAEALIATAGREGKDAYTRQLIRTQTNAGRIYPVIVPLVAVTAVYLIIDGGWDWGALWISVSFGIWLLGMVMGIAYFSQRAKRFEAQLAEGGVTDELHADVRSLHMVARVEIIVLAVLLAMMIWQPGS
jgi:uncharacterized membrane protein